MEIGKALSIVHRLAYCHLNPSAEIENNEAEQAEALDTIEDLIVNNFEEGNDLPKWEKIPDNMVSSIWKCGCTGKDDSVRLPPNFYGENGTPVCGECGDDMEYSHTEIMSAKPFTP